MTIRQIAAQLPPKFRKHLVDENIIYKAVAQPYDTHMKVLVVYYENYIFREGEKIDMTNPCMLCLGHVLEQFRILEPALIELEREANLLNEL
jgi:hypothetical protein